MNERYYNINADGYSVRCKLYSNGKASADRLVIAFHGFGGHKDNRAVQRFAERMLSKYPASAVLSFDLPCHGEDGQKKLSLKACERYIQILLSDSEERFPNAALFAYATSFGAWLCLNYFLAHGAVFEKTVLRCPCVNMYRAMTEVILSSDDLEKLQRGRDVLAGFDRKVKISRDFLTELMDNDLSEEDFIPFAENILILHGTKDEIVPVRDVLSFADRNIIEVLEIPNADHRFTDPQIMNQAIADSMGFLFS